MKRREALKAMGIGLAATAAGSALAAPAKKDRPNILWISIEDTGPHLGCYGEKHAITPNLDRFASESVRYTRAFTAAGVCAPCRSSIITGVYQSTLGTRDMRCSATLPPEIRCFSEYLRDAGYYCTNNSKQDYQFKAPAESWDASSSKGHWKNRADGQPFFAIFNITTTHEGGINNSDARTKALTDAERQDPSKLTPPPYYPNNEVTRRAWANYFELITMMDHQFQDRLDELKEAGLDDDTIVVFWSDHGVGLPRAKRWLYDSGTHVPMMVRIPEKFRVDGQGKPGATDDELICLMDLGPAMLNLCGVDVPDHMHGRPFLGPNASEPREYVYGARDRIDERYDVIRTVRDKRYRYIRNYEPTKAYYQYNQTPEKGVIMQELRRLDGTGELPAAAEIFMAKSKPVEELYDIDNDPHEIKNLAASAKHQAVLKRLRAAHEKWVFETLDTGLIPEMEIVARESVVGSRYGILRQEGGEQLIEQLRDIAAKAGEADPKNERLFGKSLSHKDAAVRYWAAIGLGDLVKPSAGSLKALDTALKDDASAVRVSSAHALCKHGRADAGLPVLEAEVTGDKEWTRLAAAIALDELDEIARSAAAALKKSIGLKGNKYVARVAVRALTELGEEAPRVK